MTKPFLPFFLLKCIITKSIKVDNVIILCQIYIIHNNLLYVIFHLSLLVNVMSTFGGSFAYSSVSLNLRLEEMKALRITKKKQKLFRYDCLGRKFKIYR